MFSVTGSAECAMCCSKENTGPTLNLWPNSPLRHTNSSQFTPLNKTTHHTAARTTKGHDSERCHPSSCWHKKGCSSYTVMSLATWREIFWMSETHACLKGISAGINKSTKQTGDLKTKWPDKDSPWPDDVTCLKAFSRNKSRHKSRQKDEMNLLIYSSLLHFGATFPTRTDESKQSYEVITSTARGTVKPDSLLSASQAY